MGDLRQHQAWFADLPQVRAAAQRSQWLAALIDQLRVLGAPLAEAQAAVRADPAHYDHAPYQEAYDEWMRKGPELHARIHDRLLGGPGDERRAAVVYLLAADEPAALGPLRETYVCTAARAGEWSAEELRALLPLLLGGWLNFELTETLGTAIAAARLLDEADRRDLAPLFRQASGQLEDGYRNLAQRRKYVRQIAAMLHDLEPARLPGGLLLPADNWAPPLLTLIHDDGDPAAVDLILHLAALGTPRPSRRWRSECLRLLPSACAREIALTGLHGLACCEPAMVRSDVSAREYPAVVCEQNAPVARGVVWAAALLGGEQALPDSEQALPGGETVTGALEAVALRTGETRRDLRRELKIAGAAIGALGEIEDPAAADALRRLDARIRHRALRRQIDTALAAVAARAPEDPGPG